MHGGDAARREIVVRIGGIRELQGETNIDVDEPADLLR